jgi:hypothetical protein
MASTEAIYNELWEPAAGGQLSEVQAILNAMSDSRLRSTGAVDNTLVIAVLFNQYDIITYLLEDKHTEPALSPDGVLEALTSACARRQLKIIQFLRHNATIKRKLKALTNDREDALKEALGKVLRYLDDSDDIEN